MGANLILEIVKVARIKIQSQGEFSTDILEDVIEDTIDGFRREGIITDDDSIENIKIEVKARLEADLK